MDARDDAGCRGVGRVVTQRVRARGDSIERDASIRIDTFSERE